MDDATKARLLALARSKLVTGTVLVLPIPTESISNENLNSKPNNSVPTEPSVANDTITALSQVSKLVSNIASNSISSNAHLIPEVAAPKQATSMDAYVLQEGIAKLQELILTAHPTLPVLLRTIHKQLRDDPELVTILSEEEIGIIINGLKVQTNTEIVTSTVKSSTTAKLKKKTLTTDMF